MSTTDYITKLLAVEDVNIAEYHDTATEIRLLLSHEAEVSYLHQLSRQHQLRL